MDWTVETFVAALDRVTKRISEATDEIRPGGCKKVDGLCIKGRRLAALLNREIGDGEDRAQTIVRMGRAAGIEPSTVDQILNGAINCPPIERLRGFARTLGVSLQSLVNAAEADGCEYGDEED